MDDVSLMRVGERIGDLDRDRESPVDPEAGPAVAAAVHHAIEARAGRELHCQVVDVAVGSRAVESDDRGMVDGRGMGIRVGIPIEGIAAGRGGSLEVSDP